MYAKGTHPEEAGVLAGTAPCTKEPATLRTSFQTAERDGVIPSPQSCFSGRLKKDVQGITEQVCLHLAEPGDHTPDHEKPHNRGLQSPA